MKQLIGKICFEKNKNKNPGLLKSISRHNVATLRHVLGITASVRRPQTKAPCFREKKWGLGHWERTVGDRMFSWLYFRGCLVLHPVPGGAHRRSGSGVRDLGVKNQVNHSPLTSHSFFRRGTPGPLIERCVERGGLYLFLSQQIQGEKLMRWWR